MSERDDYQIFDEFLPVMLDFQNRKSCKFRHRTELDEQVPLMNVGDN